MQLIERFSFPVPSPGGDNPHGVYQVIITCLTRETQVCSEDAQVWAATCAVPSAKNALPSFLLLVLSFPEQSSCSTSTHVESKAQLLSFIFKREKE